jgi:hypothetical protein
VVAWFVQHGRCEIDGDQIAESVGGLDGVGIAFAETRCMSEDLLDGDVGRLTCGRLEGGKLGDELFDGIAQVQLSLVLQHENGHRSEGFGHGGDPEKGVGLHGLFPGKIRQAYGIEREQLVFRNDHGDRSGNVVSVDELFYCCANGWVFRFGGRSECGREQQNSVDNSSLEQSSSLFRFRFAASS